MNSVDNDIFKSGSLQYCFTIDQLWQYRYGKLEPSLRTRIFEHLKNDRCDYCRERFLTLRPHLPEFTETSTLSPTAQRLLDELKQSGKKGQAKLQPLFLFRGSIWSTRAVVRSYDGSAGITVPVAGPVLILSHGDKTLGLNNAIHVIPLSDDITHVVDPLTYKLGPCNPLGYPALVEIFNVRAMLAGNLDRFVGSLSSKVFHEIMIRRERFIDGNLEIAENPIFERWCLREQEETAYLSWSVLDLADEADTSTTLTDEELVYALEPVRLAAEDESDESVAADLPHDLLELYVSDHHHLIIVQKNNHLFLRLWTDRDHPEVLYLNGIEHSLKKSAQSQDIFECDLGNGDHVAFAMEIRIRLDGEERIFCPEFHFSPPTK